MSYLCLGTCSIEQTVGSAMEQDAKSACCDRVICVPCGSVSSEMGLKLKQRQLSWVSSEACLFLPCVLILVEKNRTSSNSIIPLCMCLILYFVLNSALSEILY